MNKLLFLFLLLPFISFCQTVDIDFKISETYSTSTGPGNIVKGFFNSDTIPDLAVANNDGNSVTVFLGSGDSTFASINSFNALRPIYIVAGYIDADTNTDFAIATVNNQNYYVNIYLGAGDGVTFTSTDSNYTLGGPPTWMVGIDFNKDGVLDLATANSSSSSGSISILQGIYGGGFESAITYNAGTYPSSITAADFNADTFPDIAVTNLGDDNLYVFLSQGDSSDILFNPPAIYNTGVNPWSITTADLNNDGYFDLAVGNIGDSTISLLFNNPDSVGTFLPTQNDTIGGNVWSILVADFNKDKVKDMAITSRDSGLMVFQGVLSGNTYSYIKAWVYRDTLHNYTSLTAPEYMIAQDLSIDSASHDSLPDLIFTDHSRNNLIVLKDTIFLHPSPTAVIPPLSANSFDVKVYPVPASDVINVECKYPVLALSLCDIQGKALLYTKQNFLTISSLPAGIYLLYITTQWGSVVKQVAVVSQ